MLFFVVEELAGHVGEERAGAEAVDGDAVGAEIEGAGAGEADEGGFAGAVNVALEAAADAEDAGDVDDAAPLAGFHAGDDGAGEGHDGGEVHLDVAVPDFVGDFVDGLGIVDAGVVDEDVDLAEAFFGFDGEGFDGGAVGHVGDHPFDFDAEACADLGGGGGEFIGVAAGDEDVGAGFSEAAGHGFAEAFAAAGDEG